MSALAIRQVEHPRVTVLSVMGQLGNGEIHELEAELNRLRQHPEKGVVVECSGLKSLTGASLVRLIKFANWYRAQHLGFALAALPASVLPMLRVVGLDRKFDIQPTLELAMHTSAPAVAPELTPKALTR